MNLIFEWDEEKAEHNLRKHQIDFSEAKTIFNDPFLLTFLDKKHSDDELRFINIGMSVKERLLLVIHTEREDVIRIISSRKATRLEKSIMKKQTKSQEAHEDMLPEYDLSQMGDGERGKYYEAYRAGHTVRIIKEDDDVEVHYFTLEDGAVLLEPEVREYFPDSESVNAALRNLIALIPEKRKAANPA